MSTNISNRSLLVVIALVLVGILAVIGFQVYQDQQSDTIGESIDNMIDSAEDNAQDLKNN